jgi:hypothetical protein
MTSNSKMRGRTVSGLSLSIALFLSTLGLTPRSQAYPNFIGYGYSTCIVCHYNSQGNGPLTDYGRALYSQEIAARPWISKSLSDEDLAKLSGFIPGVELPYWVRPSINYRGLYYKTNPGGATSQSRWIQMQRDVSLVLAADEDQRTILSMTYGLLPDAKNYYGTGNNTQLISREHYIRFFLSDQVLVAAGLMDKVYGLRTSDHTSFSRANIGLGQDDQVHGVLVQWMKDKFDLTLHGFVGNLLQQEDLRQKGASIMGEYEVAEKNRLGMSFILFNTTFSDAKRLAVHDRWGIPNSKGSSIIVEAGLKEDKDVATGVVRQGNYGLIEAVVRLTRGYNILTSVERYQDENKFSSLDNQKWTFGLLTFPTQRVEIRLTGVQTKGFSTAQAADDNWSLQGQLHVSL